MPGRIILTVSSFMLFICGCSTVRVDQTTAADWNNISTVKIMSGSTAPWFLATAVERELNEMGISVAEQNASADLWLDITAVDGPDLTADSQIRRRLKSFHIAFRAPRSHRPLTTISYYFPPGTNDMKPEEGVHEAFVELRRQLGKQAKQSHAKDPGGTRQTTGKEQMNATPYQAPALQVPENEKAPNAQNHTTVPSPETDSDTPSLSSKEEDNSLSREQAPFEQQPEESPWLPRFKSWGIENWGQDESNTY